MNKVVDRAGQRYGRLLVVKRAGSNSRGTATWECLCDCGNKKTVNSWDLNNGRIKSCGCLQQESRKTAKLKHGLTKTSEYNIWLNMKARCYNENHHAYHNYGGRGIKVCDRWLESFENFIADMGNRPSLNHSIDRVNNEKNYEPDNCHWATNKEQMRNVRYNRMVTVDGMTKSVAEMAEHFGIELSTVWNRIFRDWSDEAVFKTPVTPINRFITVNGITKTVTEMARDYNIDRRLVTNRLRRGWSHEDAVKTPINIKFRK